MILQIYLQGYKYCHPKTSIALFKYNLLILSINLKAQCTVQQCKVLNMFSWLLIAINVLQ